VRKHAIFGLRIVFTHWTDTIKQKINYLKTDNKYKIS
jgi:hypothetical protein